jgi:Leucine-rich repeat (LRR) protein
MTDYSITELDLSNQGLRELPDDIHLYTKLITLYCSNNELTNLPKLPSSLQKLYCSNNELTNLPRSQSDRLSARSALELPSSLQKLYCSNNELTNLPELTTSSLQDLYCSNNQLTNLPELPYSLEYLSCYSNPFYNELGYKLTIETLPRYREEQDNIKMIDYVMK